jgi:hypothetical protein
MKGGLFTIYAGDMSTAKISFADGTYSRGQAGVRAFQCNARFDNFLFTNAVPVKLGMNLGQGQLQFTWPLCPVNVKLISSTNLPSAIPGDQVAVDPVLANGQWGLALPMPSAPGQFFWLEGR